MALRQRQDHRKNPRGTLLAFLAVAIQAMLPFFVAVAMVRAANPAFADTVSICSSLGPAAHHDTGSAGDQQGASGCPICAAVAAGLSFTAPPVVAAPAPVAGDSVVLPIVDAPQVTFAATSPYHSRGPPAIA